MFLYRTRRADPARRRRQPRLAPMRSAIRCCASVCSPCCSAAPARGWPAPTCRSPTRRSGSSGMTAGRGWIALALVVFASWLPWPAADRRLSLRRRHDPAASRPGDGFGHSVAVDVVAALSGDHHCARCDFCCAWPGQEPRAGVARTCCSSRTVDRPTACKRGDAGRRRRGTSPARTPGGLGMRKIHDSRPRRRACHWRPRWPSRAAEPLKVGFVYVGPIGDHGLVLPARRSAARRSRKPTSGKIDTTYPRERATKVPTPSAPSSSSCAPATS